MDTLDDFEAANKHPDNNYPESGSFNIVETDEAVGFELTHSEKLIHVAVFAKQA